MVQDPFVSNTLSQAESAVNTIVEDPNEALGIGQAVVGEAEQALGSSDLGAVTDFTLDTVDQASSDELASGDIGRLPFPDYTLSGLSSNEKGCRLERRDSSAGYLPGECFREPECKEVCYDGEGDECRDPTQ